MRSSNLMKVSLGYFNIWKHNKHYINLCSSYTSMHQQSIDKTALIAVCQMTSTSNKETNFAICKTFIEQASKKGAKMVFLPECFDFVGESRKQSFELAETLDGPLMSSYLDLAKEHGMWLSLGGFHEKNPSNDASKLSNAHVLVDGSGEIVDVYRKMHLFDVDIVNKVTLKESDYTIGGKRVVPPVETPVGKIGLGVCYDMRFPEFNLSLAKSGAEILTYPSAFTQTTGMAHWEAILRARAIESQCYVVAAAQTGSHNAKRTSYGHAMVVDPWGCVVACCKEGTNMALAEIDLNYVKKIRTEMPVFQHRRPDAYGHIKLANTTELEPLLSHYQFGQVSLAASQIFFKSEFSIAFVNKKPVLPGHVLVAPIKPRLRFSDLSADEVADLFICVQKIQKVIECEFGATATTIAIQDGVDAGQTIMHVHAHILPRKPNDFERNDDVYVKLQNHESNDNLKTLSEDEMAAEAEKLRKLF